MLTTNPQVIDESKIAAEIESGKSVRIQFSDPKAYNASILEQANACCRRFGSKVTIRFFGHYKDELDCEMLRHLSEARILIIHVTRATNLEAIGQLSHLDELGFGAFEGDYPKFLEVPGIQRVRSLILIDNRRNNLDLAPLASFVNLEELILCAHARNIAVLGNLHTIRRLSLNQIKNSVPLPWVRSMAGLRDLTILLGGRASINEVHHDQLERLRVDRVRGLESVDLSSFPALSKFHMEDQLRVHGLDLAPVRETLRSMTIWNCKNFENLRGIDEMQTLEFLWVGKTKVNAESLLPALPSCLREVTFAGYGKTRDAAIKTTLQERGFAPAGYVG